MRSLLVAVLLSIAAAPLPAAALGGQPLSIFVHGAGARTRLLPTYDDVEPIAIRVAATHAVSTR